MTLTEFYNFAVLAAKERGYNEPNISVVSGVFNGDIKHGAKLWTGKKHVDSLLQNNPVAAIQAFKDAIEFDNKKYGELKEDIEI